MGFDSTTAVRGSHWLCRNGDIRTFSRHSPIHQLPAVFVDDRGSESNRQQDGRMDPVSDSQWDIIKPIGLSGRGGRVRNAQLAADAQSLIDLAAGKSS